MARARSLRLRYTRRATAEVRAIQRYIARDSLSAARDVRDRIRLSIERLARFPESCRPGRVDGTRELVVPGLPYVAVYRIEDAAVLVLAVRHAARDWPGRF